MRILSLILLWSIHLFAIDATLEIVKNTNKIPYIIVEQLDSENSEYSAKVLKMLVADLKVSGHFQVYDGGIIKEKEINFKDYADKKIDLLAQIKVNKSSGKLTGTLNLYDINTSARIFSKQYSENELGRFPFIAHRMTIDTNAHIKAPSIDWMQRLVVLSKYTTSGNSEIMIADYTLTYQKVVVKGGLNIFPKWADSKQENIYYTKYLETPTIVKQNLATGEIQQLVSSEGIAVVSDVSKNGENLILSLSPVGLSDLYLYNTNTKNLRKLTNYSGIDVDGKFINNEKEIIFVSDRLGYPNIFMMRIDGGGTEQVVLHGRNNSAVDSNGQYAVYTSRETNNEFGDNTFNLYLISLAPNSNYIRRLTATGKNQMPRYSHDGRTIMFLKHYKAQSALGIIRVDYNTNYFFPLNKMKIQAFDW
ncbi:Tol-Pal system protein TolB [Helicobacter sp. MIT 05-5293]|uniref:Protein TolB n=1 Tax=uncultured Helicobacter sp. TaxID=175537 RepID=A0A650EKD8_9HELI|nr:Tol-Pal system protein TolB [Helicobacter sp. MIT 05-5293]QGT50046.1 protein TolB [uncultured Helicobacter sp.]TLD81748.1 Tol-Pal system protein TolB [Helicobacter sp. MIT 05-5293]